jgi:hypothetical protein
MGIFERNSKFYQLAVRNFVSLFVGEMHAPYPLQYTALFNNYTDKILFVSDL